MCPRQPSPIIRKLHYKERTVSKNSNKQPRPMSRHISDLSWKMGALKASSKSRSESISSAPDTNKTVMTSSKSTSCLKPNTLTNRNYYIGSTPPFYSYCKFYSKYGTAARYYYYNNKTLSI